MKAKILECELSFVNDQPRVETTAGDSRQNLIERDHLILKVMREQQPEGKKSRCQRARNGDPCVLHFLDGHRPESHDHWTIPITHAAATRQQSILVKQVSVSMDTHGGDFELAANCSAI